MVQTTAFGPLNYEMLSRGEKIMTKLEGKVAVITGASLGIGLATARRFISEGAYVYITGRRQRELDAAERQIGKNVTAVQGMAPNSGIFIACNPRGRHRMAGSISPSPTP